MSRPSRVSRAHAVPAAFALLLLAALTLPAPRVAWAQAAPASVLAELKKQGIVTEVLKNGLEVHLVIPGEPAVESGRRAPASFAPVVTVQLAVRAGVRDEPAAARGVARVVQAMTAYGTKYIRPGDLTRLVERVGGSASARVVPDGTIYEITVPAQELDLALRLTADLLRGLIFRPEALEAAKRDVADDVKRKDALVRAVEQITALAFTQHPYAFIGGVPPELDAITLEAAKAFYDSTYQPQHATLVVVGGGLELAAVKQQIRARFEAIPRGPASDVVAAVTAEPAQTEARTGLADRGAQVGIVALAWKIPAEVKIADLAPLKVAMAVLAGGETTRLGARLVTKDKLAVIAAGQLMLTAEPGLFIVYAAYRETEQGPKVAAAMRAEIARLASTPLPAAELAQAKTQLLAYVAFGVQRVAELGFQLSTSWLRSGKPGFFIESADAVVRVKPADVQRVARLYLTEAQSTMLTVPIAEGVR